MPARFQRVCRPADYGSGSIRSSKYLIKPVLANRSILDCEVGMHNIGTGREWERERETMKCSQILLMRIASVHIFAFRLGGVPNL